MSVEFTCSACRRRLGAPRRLTGVVVDCPACAEMQLVPEEIVVSSADLAHETPWRRGLIGSLVGLFACWGTILVIGTVFYTSHTQTLAQAHNPTELPSNVLLPGDCPVTKPAIQEQVPTQTPSNLSVLEIALGLLPTQDNPIAYESEFSELPATPALPNLRPKPDAPATPPPAAPSRDDTSMIVNLPPPTLPNRSLEEQVRSLMSLPEMGTTRSSRRVFINAQPQTQLASMMAVHPEFATLPVLPLVQAVREGEDALSLQALSRHMRLMLREATVRLPDGTTAVDPTRLQAMMSMKGAYGKLRNDIAAQIALLRRVRGERTTLAQQMNTQQVLFWTMAKESTQANDWIDPNAVVTLLQMLQAENMAVRYLLIELLDSIPGQRATSALALRAVFDLDPVVREAAVSALSKRPREHYRDILLMGLQYPWTPANENAAFAFVKLQDRQIAPAVQEMLMTRQPRDALSMPRYPQTVLVREPVRIRHASNCLMCHPGSINEKDLVRMEIPKQANPGVEPRGGRQQGTNSTGSDSKYGDSPSPNSLFVRADVTFLRPDFSVQLPNPRPLTKKPIRVFSTPLENLPRERFDFTVRTRLATPQEKKLLVEEPSHPALFPNRPALLYVLYHLDHPNYVKAVRKIKAEMERNGYLPINEEPPPNKLADGTPSAPARDKDKVGPPLRKAEPPPQPPAMKDEEHKELLRLRKP